MQQEADRARSFTRRALLVGGGQLVLFGSLIARLHYLQVEQSDKLRLLADDNRINERLLVPARGRIVDRLGKPLAESVPTYRVRIVRERAGELRRTLQALGEIIDVPDDLIEQVVASARLQRAFTPVSVREDLSWDEVTRIAVRAPELPGVILDSGLLRSYPEGTIVSHVLGYVGPVNRAEQSEETDPLLQLPDFRIGKNGVEKSYDHTLRGKAGISRLEVNAIGREVRELDRREAEPGADLVLTLDVGLQAYCMDRLSSLVAASTAVIDVETGAVLALASVPSYDPQVFTTVLTNEAWARLRDDPLHPLVNKCIRGQYPPGSTFKMMTALAGLETGAITPSSLIHCPGHFDLGNARFHCWREHGHGRIALVQAIAQSCDVFFYEVARRAGIDALASVANRFGLGAPAGVDLPGERGGLIPTRDWKRRHLNESWHQGETVVCGIGQGYVLATPLQLAVMAARIANGGKAVKPFLAQAEGDAAPGRSDIASIGVDPAHLALVAQGMDEVVNGGRGTARSAALGIPGIRMAGKTGTSQVRRITRSERASGAYKRKDRPRDERDHALFVCFAPVDRPRYAVSVVVEHGESGARTAGPVAKDIMTKTLEIDPARSMSLARLDRHDEAT